MSRDPARATQLKNEGNVCFQAHNYVGAESLYSKAIIADDTNPALYTNRAMARLKLRLWDPAISDCEACLKLNSESMKAWYYLAQAHLELHNYEDALASATKAYGFCVETNDRSLSQVTALVLRCKKERWDEMEKRRLREGHELEEDVISLLQQEKMDQLNSCEDEGDRAEIESEWDQKMAMMSKIFETARANSEKKRTVPDWAIDDISFGIMIDPVVTKTGKSYERASIMEHLRRHQTDPLTREPLRPAELRPNLQLKEACEEFLDQNGWAVDW